MKYLLNCRSFISLVVLFSFINNFSMEEKNEQFFEGISIKRLENGDDIAPDEIYFYKRFAFIGIGMCSSIFRKLFYPNVGLDFLFTKNIYYYIGEKKILLSFKFFFENDKDFFSSLVTKGKPNYEYFFLCFNTGLFNKEKCINYRSSIYDFFIDADSCEIFNNNNFYFVADKKLLNITDEFKKKLKITNFSEENIKNLEKWGKVLITNTDTEENLFCETDEKKEIHLDKKNANTVEGCWLKIVLRDLNKKMKEEKEKEIENLQKEKSDNKNKKGEKNEVENSVENEQNCCECICAFIENCFRKN